MKDSRILEARVKQHLIKKARKYQVRKTKSNFSSKGVFLLIFWKIRFGNFNKQKIHLLFNTKFSLFEAVNTINQNQILLFFVIQNCKNTLS